MLRPAFCFAPERGSWDEIDTTQTHCIPTPDVDIFQVWNDDSLSPVNDSIAIRRLAGLPIALCTPIMPRAPYRPPRHCFLLLNPRLLTPP